MSNVKQFDNELLKINIASQNVSFTLKNILLSEISFNLPNWNNEVISSKLKYEKISCAKKV